MPGTLTEFCDQNMHRAFPLVDAAEATDTTGSFQLPTDFITDLFMCIPFDNTLQKELFYISGVLVRQYGIEVTIGYSGVSANVAAVRGIKPSNPRHTAYELEPFPRAGSPLQRITGQVLIGTCDSLMNLPGAWTFAYAKTPILSTRVSYGPRNLQYLEVGGEYYTGVVRLREGAGVTISAATDGDGVTDITFNAVLDVPASDVQLNSDEDVLNALIARFGTPILTINGLYPNVSREFNLYGEDCSQVTPGGDNHSLVLSNPCAKPCCDPDARIEELKTTAANLNLRYQQLQAAIDALQRAITVEQSRAVSAGSTII